MANTKKIRDKEAVKEALIQEYTDFMQSNRKMRVITKNRHRVVMRPRTTIVREGYSFNLRYSPMFDSPFVDEQDVAGLNGVQVSAIVIEDEVTLGRDERCKGLFLFLHNQRGRFYDIEDAVARTAERTNIRKVRTDAMQLFARAVEGNEDAILSAYGLLTGKNPYKEDIEVVRNTVEDYAMRKPQEAKDALENSSYVYRSVYYKAVAEGVLAINGRDVYMGIDRLYRVAPEKSMEDAFIEYAISNEGVETYDVIRQKVQK